ncbi:MAG: helix-turn-helix domain-containing protein [Enterococcus sp.]
MEKAIYFRKEQRYLSSELYFLFCGVSQTLPFHSFGPAIRENYILHIVLEGKGVYFVKEQQYHLKKGDIFLIRPGETTFYRSDAEDPWVYAWLSFGGKVADEIITHSEFKADGCTMVSTDTKPYIDIILACFDYKEGLIENEVKLNELTYRFLGVLLNDLGQLDLGSQRRFSRLTVEAVDFIRQHYFEEITITEIANHLAVNRSHLSRVFKNYLDMSIQEFLIGVRINRAASLLSATEETVEAIAFKVGFNSLVVFSRMFKKSTGETPTQYRNRLKKEEITQVSAQDIKQLLESQSTVSRAT